MQSVIRVYQGTEEEEEPALSGLVGNDVHNAT